jgi:hypothetical protein
MVACDSVAILPSVSHVPRRPALLFGLKPMEGSFIVDEAGKVTKSNRNEK